MKYIVEATFTFEEIEADSEEDAESLVDQCFTFYVHHPQNNNMVNPYYSTYPKYSEYKENN